MDLLQEKKELLREKLGVFLEQQEQFAPLAARIIATLIMDGTHRGKTFEDFVQELQASKSSISTNLHLLLNLNRISYFTKTGDRKKYYRITPDIISERMNMLLNKWETEKEIHEEIKAFKQVCNDRLNPEYGNQKYDLGLHKKYLDYLDGVIGLVKGFKEEIKENESI